MENIDNMFPSGFRQFGFPRPPRPPPAPTTVEPPPSQDCWDENKCQLDKQCGKNGKCKILMSDTTGYVHLQKFKVQFQSYCLDKKLNLNCLLIRKRI